MGEVYTNTIRKGSKGKRPATFALGRDAKKHGMATDCGGYYVFKLSENYASHVRGGIAKSWGYVDRNLSYEAAINLMNKRLGRIEFEPIPQHKIRA